MGERFAIGVNLGSVVAQTRLALSLHVPLLLAVPAAYTAVVTAGAVAFVAVVAVRSLVVDILEWQLASTTADGVVLLELVVIEQVRRDAGKNV